jgi:apolipoprotein N-acyltransferase
MRPIIQKYGAALLSGVLLALAFPSWHLFPLAWVALAPLFYRVRDLKPRATFGHFLLAGWVFNSILLQWLMTNVYWAGGWAFWGYQAICLILALFWGGTGLAWSWLRTRRPWLGGPVTLSVLWVAMEFLQAHLFSGFGWGAVAYSQGTDLPLLQCAAIGGAGLVSAVVVLFNALMVSAIVEKGTSRALRIAAAAAVLALSHGAGALLLGQPDYNSMPLNAGIIQTDFPLEMKWDPEYSVEMVRNAAEKSRRLAQHEHVDLVVWPESMIMDEITTPEIRQTVVSLVKDTGCALFTGAQRFNKATNGYPNSSYLIDEHGKIVDYYDKVHLAPFGEYVPFAKYVPFIQRVVPAIGDVEPGREQKVMGVKGRWFGPLICFEVLFSDLTERLRGLGADFLVVITNLGWFGSSNAIPQELELARMRAVETRLPVVHCANTGISGVVDPWGRFTMVHAAFDPSGRYINFGRRLAPHDIIMRRTVGALPVPAPGVRPIPGGPRVFPRLAILASGLLVVWATFLPRKGLNRNR